MAKTRFLWSSWNNVDGQEDKGEKEGVFLPVEEEKYSLFVEDNYNNNSNILFLFASVAKISLGLSCRVRNTRNCRSVGREGEGVGNVAASPLKNRLIWGGKDWWTP